MKGYTIYYTYLDKKDIKRNSFILCMDKQDTIKQYTNLKNNFKQKKLKLLQIDILDNITQDYVSIQDLQECTQPGMVDGGKVDVFTNNTGKLNKDDWYKQLFELNDYE